MKYSPDVIIAPAVTHAPNISHILCNSASHLVSHHVFQANSKKFQTLQLFSSLIVVLQDEVPIIFFLGYSANLLFTLRIFPVQFILLMQQSLLRISPILKNYWLPITYR